MRKIKIIIVPMLIALIVLMNVPNTFSYDKSTIPYNIKIGLFFDKTAKSTLLLESQYGFKVGAFQQDEFINLFDLDENKILLRKDKFYIGQGPSFMEYTGAINEQANISNIQGPYHIQIGQSFTSYSEAYNFLNSLNIENVNSYLSYEKEWKVFSGLYLTESSAKEEADKINESYGYDTKVIYPSTTRVQVINEKGNAIFMYDSSDEIYFTSKDYRGTIPIVNVEGTNYRGAITAKRLSNSDMTIINKLPLEEYLYGVVPGEMPASWPIEALKAQAVAARGFALTNFNKYKQFDFNLCSTTNSQVYKGYTGEHPNTNMAVDETRSKVITYNGTLVEPYYHSNSGGYTEDSENIWSSQLSYIRGVEDKFSLDAPNSTWSVSFTKDEIKKRLANHNIFIGDILDMKITSVSNNGRVLSLVVYGTEGQEIMEKQKSRTVLGLKSSWFSINSNNNTNNESQVMVINGSSSKEESINLTSKHVITADGIYEINDSQRSSIFNGKEYRSIDEEVIENISDTFVLHGKGFGHGLGMSQYGAKKMAELNYKYDEILTHYYTGVKVE